MKLLALVHRLVPAGLAITLVVCPVVALAQQPASLAELAKREQERRKAIKVPAKVYTDRDVKPAPPPGDVATPPTPAPVVEEQKPKEAPKEQKDQAWWKARMSQVREDLRRSEMFAEALQTRINSLTADFSARDDPYQRAKIADDRQKAVAELDRVKSEAVLLKKQITDIEEEARKAGVPPGWIR
jgi:hypothetical protein